MFQFLFAEPKSLQKSHVFFIAVLLICFFLWAPSKYFLKTNIGWNDFSVIFIFSLVTGLWAAIKANKRIVEQTDAFYIRSWWSFLSGIISLPFCLLFRRIAMDWSLALTVFGLGSILGSILYRKWKNFI